MVHLQGRDFVADDPARKGWTGSIEAILGRDDRPADMSSGGEGTRTLDLRLAKPPLFQLSYTPGSDRGRQSGNSGRVGSTIVGRDEQPTPSARTGPLGCGPVDARTFLGMEPDGDDLHWRMRRDAAADDAGKLSLRRVRARRSARRSRGRIGPADRVGHRAIPVLCAHRRRTGLGGHAGCRRRPRDSGPCRRQGRREGDPDGQRRTRQGRARGRWGVGRAARRPTAR